MPFQNGRNAFKMGEMPFHGVPFHFQKCIFKKSHGNFYFTPVFLREKILLPRFDALPLELAESLLAIAVFCCDFSRKKDRRPPAIPGYISALFPKYGLSVNLPNLPFLESVPFIGTLK